MFILVVSGGCPTDNYKGHGIFELDQAKALQQFGHKVILAVVDLRSIRRKRKFGFSSFKKDDIQVEEINIPIGRIPKRIFKSIGSKAFSYLYKEIEIKYGKPDIVHAHFYGIASFCCDNVKKNKIPFVITEHSSNVNQSCISESLKKEISNTYTNAVIVIAVGNTLSKNIYKHSGIKAVVIPNVLSSVVLECNIDSVKSLHDGFVFVTACYLIESKRIELLIDAFNMLPYNDIYLHIFGDGPLKESLTDKVEKLDVKNRIFFYGFCSREILMNTYKNADCFVLPSRTETFGVAYIEAMSMGLPVIATRCGGPEDFVNAQNGILVDVDDVQPLIDAMEQIHQNIGTYDRQQISDFTLKNFSPEVVARQLTSIYKSL